jgi:SAM-dependent methyltransferase
VTTDPYRLAAEHFDLLITDAWRILRPALTTALKGADPAGPILDLGAGTGIGTKVIAELAPRNEIVAVEPSAALRVGLFARLADHPELRDRVTVLPADALGAELPGRLGGVVAMNMIGHLAPEERAELWQRLAVRLLPHAPLVLNLQPPARAEAVPEMDFASVTVGKHTYRGKGSAEPAGESTVVWRMTYQVLHGNELISESVAEYSWWVLDADQLIAELAAAGFACRRGDADLVIAER